MPIAAKDSKAASPVQHFLGKRKKSNVILIDVGPFKKETLSELFEGCYWNEKYSDRVPYNGMQIIQCDSFELNLLWFLFFSFIWSPAGHILPRFMLLVFRDYIVCKLEPFY